MRRYGPCKGSLHQWKIVGSRRFLDRPEAVFLHRRRNFGVYGSEARLNQPTDTKRTIRRCSHSCVEAERGRGEAISRGEGAGAIRGHNTDC